MEGSKNSPNPIEYLFIVLEQILILEFKVAIENNLYQQPTSHGGTKAIHDDFLNFRTMSSNCWNSNVRNWYSITCLMKPCSVLCINSNAAVKRLPNDCNVVRNHCRNCLSIQLDQTSGMQNSPQHWIIAVLIRRIRVSGPRTSSKF